MPQNPALTILDLVEVNEFMRSVITYFCSFSQLFINRIYNILEAWIRNNQTTCRTAMRKVWDLVRCL